MMDDGMPGLVAWVRETWEDGIDKDGLYMYLGNATGSREYVARREGDICEIGVSGGGDDGVRAYGIIPWSQFSETVLARILPVDWLPYYSGEDSEKWRLTVRWNGQFLARSGGDGGGPAGHEAVLRRIEFALCPLLGVRPR